MKEQLYTITRADKPGRYLKGLGIGCCNTLFPCRWTSYIPHAILLNEEEGTETIKYITNVIDQDLGEQLYLKPLMNVPEQF